MTDQSPPPEPPVPPVVLPSGSFCGACGAKLSSGAGSCAGCGAPTGAPPTSVDHPADERHEPPLPSPVAPVLPAGDDTAG